MKVLSLLILGLIITACGKKDPTKFVTADQASFSKYINLKNIEASPNLNLDKAIVNNDYPIEIALYQDQNFYYNLPNLGDGQGTWNYENGHIVLKAKRKIFDMRIDVHAIDQAAQNLAIEFTDRFGPNVLKVSSENMDTL